MRYHPNDLPNELSQDSRTNHQIFLMIGTSRRSSFNNFLTQMEVTLKPVAQSISFNFVRLYTFTSRSSVLVDCSTIDDGSFLFTLFHLSIISLWRILISSATSNKKTCREFWQFAAHDIVQIHNRSQAGKEQIAQGTRNQH